MAREYSLKQVCQGPYFRVLGFIPGKGVVFADRMSGEINKIPYSQLAGAMTQYSLAPPAWWAEIAGTEKVTREQREIIGSVVVHGARKTGVYSSLNERGRGVIRHNDEIYIHLGNKVVVDGKKKDLDDVQVGLHWLPAAPLNYGRETVGKARREAGEQILRFAWSTKADGIKLLGWLVCAMLGGALRWRPHAWFSGGSGAGKTWLMNYVVKPILGDWMVLVSGRVTAAGLTRMIGSTSMPITFDESEVDGTSRQAIRQEVLQLMRISSSGEGRTLKADGDSTSVVTTQPRSCFLLSSITQPMAAQADATRLAVIKLSTKRYPQNVWIPMEREIVRVIKSVLPGLRYDILRDAENICEMIDAARKFALENGCGTRESDQISALAGAASWWGCVPYEEIVTRLITAYKRELVSQDAEILINDIFSADLRRGRGDPLPVSQAISYVMGGSATHVELLSKSGIRVVLADDPAHVLVGTRWPAFQTLLRRTRWEGVDLRAALLMHPLAGDVEGQVMFAGTRQRGVIRLSPLEDLIEPTYGSQVPSSGSGIERSYHPQGELPD